MTNSKFKRGDQHYIGVPLLLELYRIKAPGVRYVLGENRGIENCWDDIYLGPNVDYSLASRWRDMLRGVDGEEV